MSSTHVTSEQEISRSKPLVIEESLSGCPSIRRLLLSLRIVLESVLRNCDGRKLTSSHVAQLAHLAAMLGQPVSLPK